MPFYIPNIKNWSSRKHAFESKYKKGMPLDSDDRLYHIATIIGLLGI